MSGSVFVIDDDEVSRLIIEHILTSDGYTVTAFCSSREAVDAFEAETYDCVLSDYFMPELNGEQVLTEIRLRDPFVPVIFLTNNTNIGNAVRLIKNGADDYIPKPIVKEDLLFRLSKTIREKETARYVEQVIKEKEILDLENRRLVNWRSLYASKDVKQTEQLIRLLSRTINQSGGFLWVDLLEGDSRHIGEAVTISSDLYDLILSSSRGQKEVFDYITFISNLDSMPLEQERITAGTLFSELRNELEEVIFPIVSRHGRIPLFVQSSLRTSKVLSLDLGYLKKIFREIAVNAIKYSPEQSRVFFMIEDSANTHHDGLDIIVRNIPRKTQKTDDAGKPIIGIPYEYSELVFDLFYTIDAFPCVLEDEEWRDGTGLYVCRKLLRRQGGWISTANGIDYTGETPETFVKFTITLPYCD